MTRSCLILALFALLAITSGELRAGDWPRLLGPADRCVTTESGLRKELAGLQPLWEMPKGSGFGGPAIVGDSLILFHRVDEEEVVDCRNATSGKQKWVHRYAAEYRPRYGGSTGPRTSPVIANGRVFTFGIMGHLHALDLVTGKVIWQRDCARDFAMKPVFFGFGSTPLVLGNRLIVQVGGEVNGKPVNSVALDVETGKLMWSAEHEWGASYASPIPTKLHGRDCVLVFAGGESRPPTGGLLVIDVANGKVLSETPHRADIAESVNASSPVMLDQSRVFVSEAYSAGGVCVQIDEKFTARPVWKAENFGTYWMTPIVKDGCVFGFAGMSERLAELVCHDVETGREIWRNDMGGGFSRASLLQTGDGVLCLGEYGDLAWVDLSKKGVSVISRLKLFEAPETWTLPALANGRLYMCQNEPGRGGTKPRLICYDFRAP